MVHNFGDQACNSRVSGKDEDQRFWVGSPTTSNYRRLRPHSNCYNRRPVQTVNGKPEDRQSDHQSEVTRLHEVPRDIFLRCYKFRFVPPNRRTLGWDIHKRSCSKGYGLRRCIPLHLVFADWMRNQSFVPDNRPCCY